MQDLRHTRRLFAVVVRVKQVEGNVHDPVLNLPLMEIEEEKTIVGLPSIAGRKLYMVDIQDVGLVWVPWEIHLL